ncbi:uncharacterized protein LOC115792004 [Archocentrus centrarchus]|uniref:uncharacterized protein LOC115792004 n=1 Tax=Archocentrus centrarchus TaxID=63155 RepID=UPI0011EA4428|nr:uncharacterized protein LOC115792004 [Archocentrus centrarchus]
MILTSRSLCLPSRATVHELFSVARDASIIPDISLDPVLTTFLSLDSPAALQHHYNFLQRSMSGEQQTLFNLNLTAELGGSRVTYGGVGVVALALSMLFDQVAQQVRAQGSTEVRASAQRSWPKRIFGISTSSRIGWIVHSYLGLIPGIANNQNRMAETTELYDNWLKLELLDHYERMTTRKRMSSVSMQQWLTGAAFHMHVRIHQARLHSVPLGSVNSLRLSYKTGLGPLIRGYTAYLRKNIQETPAPGPQKPRTSAASRPTHTNSSLLANRTCSSSVLFNVSRDGPSNESATPSSPAGITRGCNTDGPGGDFGSNVLSGSSNTTMSKTLNASSRYNREEEGSILGLLVIEPSRNVSHSVQHHPCESAAIQDALLTRIINAQDLERNRNFFLYPDKVFQCLLKQRDDFELRTN